jgi:TRAP-type transport system small permease protein
MNVKRLIDSFFKLLEFLVVACLVAMVIMVFGNVVLRWVFNSGIMVSEEMSRYCFMWLTYIGAMVAMRENGHLGVDTLVRRLPLGGKKFCVLLSECLMLFCNALFFIGTWKMHELQVTNVSPVVGISMIWIYGIGYFVGVVMGLFNINRLYRLLTGQMTEDEMVMVVDAEGLKEAEETIKNAEAKNAENKHASAHVTTPQMAGSKA